MSREPVRLTATSSQTVGPFFHFGLAANSSLGCLAGPDTPGEHITLRIRVLDGDAAPVPDALIEIWQADAAGTYVRPSDPKTAVSPPGFCGFGRLPTEADGTCVFKTIRPGRVRDDRGGWQAPHINLCLFARGLLRQVYTRVYLADEPGLDADPIIGLVPQARRPTLLARRAEDGTWSFDITLQGENETVFFDL
jgi:protocatechuate 3,4-dioxygenase, alpha subunit